MSYLSDLTELDLEEAELCGVCSIKIKTKQEDNVTPAAISTQMITTDLSATAAGVQMHRCDWIMVVHRLNKTPKCRGFLR